MKTRVEVETRSLIKCLQSEKIRAITRRTDPALGRPGSIHTEIVIEMKVMDTVNVGSGSGTVHVLATVITGSLIMATAIEKEMVIVDGAVVVSVPRHLSLVMTNAINVAGRRGNQTSM